MAKEIFKKNPSQTPLGNNFQDDKDRDRNRDRERKRERETEREIDFRQFWILLKHLRPVWNQRGFQTPFKIILKTVWNPSQTHLNQGTVPWLCCFSLFRLLRFPLDIFLFCGFHRLARFPLGSFGSVVWLLLASVPGLARFALCLEAHFFNADTWKKCFHLGNVHPLALSICFSFMKNCMVVLNFHW